MRDVDNGCVRSPDTDLCPLSGHRLDRDLSNGGLVAQAESEVFVGLERCAQPFDPVVTVRIFSRARSASIAESDRGARAAMSAACVSSMWSGSKTVEIQESSPSTILSSRQNTFRGCSSLPVSAQSRSVRHRYAQPRRDGDPDPGGRLLGAAIARSGRTTASAKHQVGTGEFRRLSSGDPIGRRSK
jgi:hypothetical protein